MRLRKAWFRMVQVSYDLFLKLNPRKLAAHAVIVDGEGRVLSIRSRYGDVWQLPGGGLGRHENLDSALIRECREELGVGVLLDAMTGLYYHRDTSTYVGIFRCRITEGEIRLSHEHTEYRYLLPAELPQRLQPMVADALQSDGEPALRTFG
jgi:8-oxo-dGTP diphosphatase